VHGGDRSQRSSVENAQAEQCAGQHRHGNFSNLTARTNFFHCIKVSGKDIETEESEPVQSEEADPPIPIVTKRKALASLENFFLFLTQHKLGEVDGPAMEDWVDIIGRGRDVCQKLARLNAVQKAITDFV
jgi:hypothetical protein